MKEELTTEQEAIVAANTVFLEDNIPIQPDIGGAEVTAEILVRLGVGEIVSIERLYEGEDVLIYLVVDDSGDSYKLDFMPDGSLYSVESETEVLYMLYN